MPIIIDFILSYRYFLYIERGYTVLSYCLSVSLVLFNVHIVFAEQNHYEGQKIGFQFFFLIHLLKSMNVINAR